jgi:tRNA dimethylallyltransferase
VVEYLQGKRDLASAINQTKLDVRHYAKRQITWFRRESGAIWFNGFGEEDTIRTAILESLQHSRGRQPEETSVTSWQR